MIIYVQWIDVDIDLDLDLDVDIYITCSSKAGMILLFHSDILRPKADSCT